MEWKGKKLEGKGEAYLNVDDICGEPMARTGQLLCEGLDGKAEFFRAREKSLLGASHGSFGRPRVAVGSSSHHQTAGTPGH